ncbi:MAG: hypothetical protein H7A33_05805 [Deltaproteobacteria bacterium]|nr:hypothetical protein [Deltaproteobacteria bacterium]
MNKIKFFTLTALMSFFVLLSFANAAIPPVDEVSCEPGGEHGFLVTIILSHDYEYGSYIIERKKAGKNFERDLSAFKGGRYSLDLNSQGGFVGYKLQFREPGKEVFQSITGEISCAGSAGSESQ